MDNRRFSDEILNAYIDNELDQSERKAVIEAIQDNPELGQRICKIEHVRSMLRVAYQEPIKIEQSSNNKRLLTRRYASIAASILLVVGFAIGWTLHTTQSTNALLSIAKNNQSNVAVGQEQDWNVLLHVTSDDPYRLKVVLDETESILKDFESRQQKVSIKILANGKGLNLLRNDTSPYAQRIKNLQNEYENVVFVACSKAIERLETEKGIRVELLPNTQIAPSAVNEVLNRQREGWTYIKI